MAEILDHMARVGLTPAAYLELMTNQAAGDPDDLSDDLSDDSEREKREFTKLNLFCGRNRGEALDAAFVSPLTVYLEGAR